MFAIVLLVHQVLSQLGDILEWFAPSSFIEKRFAIVLLFHQVWCQIGDILEWFACNQYSRKQFTIVALNTRGFCSQKIAHFWSSHSKVCQQKTWSKKKVWNMQHQCAKWHSQNNAYHSETC